MVWYGVLDGMVWGTGWYGMGTGRYGMGTGRYGMGTGRYGMGTGQYGMGTGWYQHTFIQCLYFQSSIETITVCTQPALCVRSVHGMCVLCMCRCDV